MRIGVLNWRDLSHPHAGGAERFVHEIAGRWARAGHEVTLVCSRRSGSSRVDRIDGVDILRVGRLATAEHHARAPALLRRRPRPDVVLESINTIPYWLPIRMGTVPTVSLFHQMAIDVWDLHLPRPLAALARRAELLEVRPYRSKRVLAVSDSTAEDLRAAGLRNVATIPQGGIGAQRLRSKEAVPTVIFVGRLAANKRPDHAVDAFVRLQQQLPEARMWIVGEGPMERNLARRLPLGAAMLGRLDRSELYDRMSRAHLLLTTSVREGWGLVVTEANALGTPAVGYAVGGLRDAIRDGITGRLIDQDPQALAAATAALLRDTAVYERMRAAAIDWGASFTWDRTADRILKALEERAASRALAGRTP